MNTYSDLLGESNVQADGGSIGSLFVGTELDLSQAEVTGFPVNPTQFTFTPYLGGRDVLTIGNIAINTNNIVDGAVTTPKLADLEYINFRQTGDTFRTRIKNTTPILDNIISIPDPGTSTSNFIIQDSLTQQRINSEILFDDSITLNALTAESILSTNLTKGIITSPIQSNAILTTDISKNLIFTQPLDGEILIGSNTTSPSVATITGSANISVTNGSNSITLDTTQNISPTSNAEFNSIKTSAGTSGVTPVKHWDLGPVGGIRWRFGLFGSESGGNAGSNLTILGYDDSSVQSVAPLTIRRVDGAILGGFYEAAYSTDAYTIGYSGGQTHLGASSYASSQRINFPLSTNNPGSGVVDDVAYLNGTQSLANKTLSGNTPCTGTFSCDNISSRSTNTNLTLTGNGTGNVIVNDKLASGGTNLDTNFGLTITASSVEGVVRFYNSSNVGKWHYALTSGLGLNLAESGVADYRIYVNPGGNVGIGNNNNSYKLDVSGSIRSSSTGYYFPSGSEVVSIADSEVVGSNYTCNGANSSIVSVRSYIIGKQVSVVIPATTWVSGTTPSTAIGFGGTVGTNFRPSTTISSWIRVMNNAVAEDGYITISTAGVINIFRTSTANYTNSAACGILVATTVSYYKY